VVGIKTQSRLWHWIVVVVALGLSVSASLVYFTKRELPAYPISACEEGVSVNLGEIQFPSEPLSITVPLQRLDLRADSVTNVRATCGCTSASLDHERQEIDIKFVPRRDMTKVHESVLLTSSDAASGPKAVHLTGNVVPAWTADPGSLSLERVLPDERRAFWCTVTMARECTRGCSCRLLPKSRDISLQARRLCDRKILIEGVARGSTEQGTYRGQIKLMLGQGAYSTVTVPISVEHIGAVTSEPALITLSSKGQRGAIAAFKHFDGRKLHIKRIESPSHLRVSPLRDKGGACSIRVELGDLVTAAEERVTVSTVGVSFEETDARAKIRVVVLRDSTRR